MAKKHKQEEVVQRQTRKEVLLARKRKRQNRQVYLAVGIVVGLLALVLLVAIVNEYFIKPGQPVATVNGESITTREWQTHVRYQRAQLIMSIEDLTEAFGGDLAFVQQYAGQQIGFLQDPVTLGQLVLDDIVNQVLTRQGAEARGITVTDADVQEAIEDSFGFYGGESPTPMPTPAETVVPTPSLTPIPTPVITEVVPTDTPFPTPTLGPTSTPLPTATPLSAEAFQAEYNEMLARLRRFGVDEATFRMVVRAQLYRERLMEALAEETGLLRQAEHASFYLITFDSEDEANAALQEIEQEGFLAAWNRIRSTPADPAEPNRATARELLWRTRNDVETTLSPEVVAAVFELPVGVPSDVIEVAGMVEDDPSEYYLIQVSGREVRDLTEAAIRNEQQQLLASWLETQRFTGVETTERWRGRVPRQPALDPQYLIPAATQPPLPEIPLPEP